MTINDHARPFCPIDAYEDPYEEMIRSAFFSLAQDYFPELVPKNKTKPSISAKFSKEAIASKIAAKTEPYPMLPAEAAFLSSAFSPLDSSSCDPFISLAPIRSYPEHSLSPVYGTERSKFESARSDFPILCEKINGKQLIWLDNAATTQKPACVIERLKYFYEHENANAHRGAHALAVRATDAYEGARKKAADFLNAADSNEIVFVRGTTEAVNLVAHSYGMQHISKDDKIVLSALEHHANIVPWQTVCQRTGAKLSVFPVDDTGQVILEEFEKLLSENVKLVAFTHISNAIGTITPAAELIKMAHKCGTKVLVDGAQAAAHIPVDVQALDCDFYTFSGHKVFGPTGIGVLYAKADILNSMQPYQTGGSMISDVTFEKSTYRSPPYLFEAGTSSIADAAALGAALDYITGLGLDEIFGFEHRLLEYAVSELLKIPESAIVGSAKRRSGILSFTVKGYTPDEIGRTLDREGIAIRAGHHCAQPVLRRFGLESTARLSLAFYNTFEEIDRFVYVLKKMIQGYP